jgi:hypothetical protein
MPSARDEAWRFFTKFGWFGVPIVVTPLPNEKKKIAGLVDWRVGYYDGPRDDAEMERAWRGHEDALGLGIFVGARSGVCAIDPDTDAAEEYIRKRGHPRTASFRSRRGVKRLFRYPKGGELRTGHIVDGLELRADMLLIVPPTPGYDWLPSADVEEAGLAPLPGWAKLNGKPRREQITIQTGTDMPAGAAHEQTLRIVGKLARTLPPEDLLTTAAALNQGRLPADELRDIVENIAAKEWPAPEVPDVEPFEPAEGLADVHDTFTRLLLLPDTAVLDVALATIAHHRRGTGEPVWPLLVSPPSGGKTEIIRALSGAPEVYPLSSLTAQTLVSGMGKGKSLLPRLDDMGKSILTLKDFTTVLELQRDARSEILAQLRELYDGSFRKEFGTGEGVEWEGRLGFLAGVTPVIDTRHAATAILGERFSYLRLTQPPRKQLADRILAESVSETEMRVELKDAVARFFAGLVLGEPPEMDDETRAWLIGLGDLVSFARSAVQRESYTHEILVVPEPEANPRLLKQLAGMYQALLMIGSPQAEARRIVVKVARDSAPVARVAVLRTMADEDGPLSTSELANRVALPTATAARVADDLVALRLMDCERRGSGKANVYTLTFLGARMWVDAGWL